MFEKRYKSHHNAKAEYSEFLPTKMANIEEFKRDIINLEYGDEENCIYIHVPYCDKICSFCNMNRMFLKDPLDDFVNGVLQQIDWYKNLPHISNLKIGSIYFGGGTPTVLSIEQFEKIITALKSSFNLVSNCEISSETTLHNLSIEKVRAMEKMGFNRYSIGIQTFIDEGRKYLNRTYNKEETIQKLKEIKENFNGIVCIDKIYNYKGETLENLKEDIQIIKDLKIDSFSFYSLMIHNGSALSKNGDEIDLIEASDREYHDFFVNSFNKNDYKVLELTKIALKNRDKYKYIKIRHRNGNTIPLGIGAGGSIGKYRIMVKDFNTTIFMKNLNEDNRDKKVQLLYGLIQEDLLSFDELNSIFNEKEIETLTSSFNNLIKGEYLTKNYVGYKLTPKGMFYGNNLCGYLCRTYLENL